MTIEILNQKKAALEQRKEQALANTHAISGAIQIIDELIAEENKSKMPMPPAGPTLIEQGVVHGQREESTDHRGA